MQPPSLNRREFVKAATGTAIAATGCSFACAGDSQATGSKIKIGVRFNDRWLNSPGDADLKFFKQIGVDCVDITLNLIPGYAEHGVFAKADLDAFVRRLDDVGLKIERANSLGPHYLNAHLNRAAGEQEISKLQRVGEMLAEAEIPVYGIQACQAALHTSDSRAGWTRESRRGGYQYPRFSIQRSQARSPQPKYKVTEDQLWRGLVNIYKRVMPTVEGSKTVIAMHGNDPPLYNYLGNPQILCRFADFDRLFSEVPSEHNGITFCVGTRYESGENVFDGIRHFGSQRKLFHVHFRNVRGTLPQGGYSEVFPDDGDLEMIEVLRALNSVGYRGAIDYDHAMGITGDEPLPKQYIAFAVGHMRGMLSSL